MKTQYIAPIAKIISFDSVSEMLAGSISTNQQEGDQSGQGKGNGSQSGGITPGGTGNTGSLSKENDTDWNSSWDWN